jgi:hypothetical protein
MEEAKRFKPRLSNLPLKGYKKTAIKKEKNNGINKSLPKYANSKTITIPCNINIEFISAELLFLFNIV